MKKHKPYGFSCAWVLPAVKLGLGVVPVLAPAFPAAFAQDTRDADIFGSPEPEAVGSPAPQPAPQPSPASDAVTESARESSLRDSLQVGGRAEVRANTGQEENQKLPAGSFNQLKQADVYFDSRPNKDVRAFLRFRLSEESRRQQARSATDASAIECTQCFRTDLDELWLKWDWDDTAFFTAGKQHLKWGSGRFWNPTDFTALETRDPFALFDRRLGQTLLKIHIPVEKQGFNYYAIVQFDDARRNDDLGGALRGEFAFLGSSELALSFQTRRNQPLRFGADISSALGPIDIHLETAVSKRNKQTFFRGDIDPATGTLPEAYTAERRWFTQSVGGVEKTFKYSDEDAVSLGAEYFFNQLGYDDKELEVYSFVLGQSRPLYAGRQYAGGYVRLPTPGTWNKTSFFVNSIQNISDSTNVTRLTTTWTFFNELTLEAYGSRCFGDAGELCFRLPAAYAAAARAPGIPDEQRRALATLPTRRTRNTAGLGLSMNF